MLKHLKILCYILSLSLVFIQQGKSQFTKDWQPYIGYMGNILINPGVSGGIEKEIWTNDNFIQFLNMKGIGNTSTYLNANLSTYWDPFSHVGILNYYEFNIRQYLGRRLGLQIGLGPGWQTNLTSDNYVVKANGQIKERALHANFYFAPEISSAIIFHNRDLSRTWISKINIVFLMPYNSAFLPTFNYELVYQF